MMNLLSYAFMQRAFFVSLCMAILCPCIGIFLVMRKHSMIGDSLSHASLAGVTLGLFFHQNPIWVSFIFTSLCGLSIEWLQTYFRKHSDLILSIVYTLSVGIAICLISYGSLQSNADAYLFGSILAITNEDMIIVSILFVLTIAAIVRYYHEMLYITFDNQAAQIAHIPYKRINYIFSVLVCATIAISIRLVGAMVIGSMLTMPVAAALQYHKGFKQTLWISIGISLINCICSLFGSYFLNVAPGGLCALISVGMLAISFLFRHLNATKSLNV